MLRHLFDTSSDHNGEPVKQDRGVYRVLHEYHFGKGNGNEEMQHFLHYSHTHTVKDIFEYMCTLRSAVNQFPYSSGRQNVFKLDRKYYGMESCFICQTFLGLQPTIIFIIYLPIILSIYRFVNKMSKNNDTCSVCCFIPGTKATIYSTSYSVYDHVKQGKQSNPHI